MLSLLACYIIKHLINIPFVTFTVWLDAKDWECLLTVWSNWPSYRLFNLIITGRILLALLAIEVQDVIFLKMGPTRPSFSLFSSFQYTVDSKQMFYINKFLPMTGFEPRTSGIRSDHSTNWATQPLPSTWCYFNHIFELCRWPRTLLYRTWPVSNPHRMIIHRWSTYLSTYLPYKALL